MQMEYDLNDTKIDESRNGNLHTKSRFPWRTLANLRSTTPPWKKNDVSSDKKDEQNRHISTGGGVAVIIALAVGIALIVLVAVFVVFRKRYGPRYTVRTFFSGLRPGADRRGTSGKSCTPACVESGFRCRETVPNRNTKPKPRSNTPATGSSSCQLLLGTLDAVQTQPERHSRQSSATIDPNLLSAPPHDSHPRTQPVNINKGRRKEPPAALQRTDLGAATEQLKTLAPTSPCSRLTTSTRSSGPLPSIYRMALGPHKRGRKSYQLDARSAADSDDRVLSLPSPSPILRNILRPSPKADEPLPSHVYRMQVQQPQTPTYETRECAPDIVLPILPRSVFVPNNN